MACEYQKDITFDEIRAGDVVLIEYFSAEGAYLGDSRGTASYLFDGIWHFYDRGPLYRESGYRLFKVTDLDAKQTGMEEHRLLVLVNKAKADRDRAFSGGADMNQALGNQCDAVVELAGEVERLRGRLEAVCAVVSDAAAFGEPVSSVAVMEAVRGE
jgi:hypothetical protein